MKQSTQLSGYDALSVNDSQSPLLFPPLHSGVEQNLDNVWHLIFLCFADVTGEKVLFLNMLDMASHYQVVFPAADKDPLTVFYGFLLGWCLTLGVPECLRFDLGGAFESSFSELAEQIGCRLLPAASVSPTQNAPCERAGGAWKYRARRLVDQFSIKWNDSSTKLWRCAVLNWLTNTAIGDSGHSPGQWVLGRTLRLPFQLLSRAAQLASHQRHHDDFAYQRRVAMLAEAQRSIISTRHNKAPSRAFLARARSANNAPSQIRFCSWRPSHVLAWKQHEKKSMVDGLVVSGNCREDMKVLQTCGSVIAMLL